MLGWLRNHPRLVDGAVAGVVFLYNLAVPLEGQARIVLALLSAGVCFPYIWRRNRPMLTFAVMFAGMALVSVAQLLFDTGALPINGMLFLGLYNVAARCSRNVSVAAAGITELWAVCAVLALGGDPATEAFIITIFLVSVWSWGYTSGTRRAYLASLEERTGWLERERQNQAQLAAAAERARIAREMHDVVSHSLSVMVAQADGATYTLRNQPDRAEQALATVSDTGRSALNEMRRMLGVLRDGEPEHSSYAPRPGVAQVDQLVEEVRRSGLPVEFAVEGEQRALPSGMELAAYRIVQEALTNTRKHAGPGVSQARVWLRYGGEALEIRVSDDGRGAATPSGNGTSGGHGIVGMRERAAAYGGSVHSGPRTGGGFETIVSLPVETLT